MLGEEEADLAERLQEAPSLRDGQMKYEYVPHQLPLRLSCGTQLDSSSVRRCSYRGGLIPALAFRLVLVEHA